MIRLILAEMRLSVFADQPFLRQMRFRCINEQVAGRRRSGHLHKHIDINQMYAIVWRLEWTNVDNS